MRHNKFRIFALLSLIILVLLYLFVGKAHETGPRQGQQADVLTVDNDAWIADRGNNDVKGDVAGIDDVQGGEKRRLKLHVMVTTTDGIPLPGAPIHLTLYSNIGALLNNEPNFIGSDDAYWKLVKLDAYPRTYYEYLTDLNGEAKIDLEWEISGSQKDMLSVHPAVDKYFRFLPAGRTLSLCRGGEGERSFILADSECNIDYDCYLDVPHSAAIEIEVIPQLNDPWQLIFYCSDEPPDSSSASSTTGGSPTSIGGLPAGREISCILARETVIKFNIPPLSPGETRKIIIDTTKGEPLRSITGICIDESGRPVGGADVTLEYGGLSFSATSKKTGEFAVKIPPGDGNVKVLVNVYVSGHEFVTREVSPDEDYLELVLRAIPAVTEQDLRSKEFLITANTSVQFLPLCRGELSGHRCMRKTGLDRCVEFFSAYPVNYSRHAYYDTPFEFRIHFRESFAPEKILVYADDSDLSPTIIATNELYDGMTIQLRKSEHVIEGVVIDNLESPLSDMLLSTLNKVIA